MATMSDSNLGQQRTFAVILAAGKGTRFNESFPKQFIDFKFGNMVERCLSSFASVPILAGVVLVVPEDRKEDINASVQASNPKIEISIVSGGDSRPKSIHLGLQAVDKSFNPRLFDNIIVHDAARFLVSPEQILNVVEDIGSEAVTYRKITDTTAALSANEGPLELSQAGEIVSLQTPIKISWQTANSIVSSKTAELDHGVAGLLIQRGIAFSLVESDGSTEKITFPSDAKRLGL